jgi:hypothetical protein
MLVCACAVSLVLAQIAETYEEIAVAEGGTVIGTVLLDGKVPGPKGYNLTTLPDAIYCGRISDGRGWRLLQPFNAGPNGEFRQVVVFLDDIERGKPFGEYQPPKIEAVDCRFLPFVNVVRDLHDVVVVNMDPALHDIQAYETSHLGPRILFNVPLPISNRYPREAGLSAHFKKHYEGAPVTQTVKMTKGRHIFTMQCGFHAYLYGKLGLGCRPPLLHDYGQRRTIPIDRYPGWHLQGKALASLYPGRDRAHDHDRTQSAH